MLEAVRQHWPEYLMEAAGLGLFMVSACVFTVILWHPASPLRGAIPDPVLRRIFTGGAMGLTLIAIVYSPWGKQSGAHLNPVVTLTFYRLGKIEFWDACFYALFQFAGGLAGVLISALLLRSVLAHPDVDYAATLPGPRGALVAFFAELFITFLLMSMILNVTNSRHLGRFTGIFAGILVAAFITVESPLSGMSMNPARTLGSAFPAHHWAALWVYFTAPAIGMLAAAEIYLWLKGESSVICAKLHHANDKRCIFHCGYKKRQALSMMPAGETL
ncbi:MAG: MIP/aquaporin family protein [Actinomycetota bacterium]